MVELVDTLDLKSNGPITAVRVQVPLRVPLARIAQLVEHDLAKVGVAGSSPVSRSLRRKRDEKFIPMKIGESRFSLKIEKVAQKAAFF